MLAGIASERHPAEVFLPTNYTTRHALFRLACFYYQLFDGLQLLFPTHHLLLLMERRHFLQLSGTTLGGLLCWPALGEAAPRRPALRLPEAVFVQLADGVHALTSTDQKTWTYQDVTVRLSYQQHELQVAVQAPTRALREVQLRWPYALAAGATLCGDQWERPRRRGGCPGTLSSTMAATRPPALG